MQTPPTTFSLSTQQVADINTLVGLGTTGPRKILGVRIAIHHAADPINPPRFTAELVYNPADGGPLLGREVEIGG